MVNPLPRDIGNVQQAVNAAKINKGTVIGDVLDDTVEHLTFFQVGHEFRAGLGA